MQVTVYGASGKVGSLVVEEALRRGFTVVAFVHHTNLFSPSGNLIIRKGNIYDAEDVAEALEGSKAVISCLGSWGTRGRDILSRFVTNVEPAMQARDIRRIVTLTGIGVQTHPGALHVAALRSMRWLPFGKVFADAERHAHMLAQSVLDWTAVCSPVMNNIGGPAYRLDTKTGNPLATIARSSVAAALLDQLEADEFLRQTTVIHRS